MAYPCRIMIAVLSLLLVSCGVKQDLRLPTDATPTQKTQSPTPSATSAPDKK